MMINTRQTEAAEVDEFVTMTTADRPGVQVEPESAWGHTFCCGTSLKVELGSCTLALPSSGVAHEIHEISRLYYRPVGRTSGEYV